MAKSIQNIIRELAQELDCGNDCYFNLKTQEIITIPNDSQHLFEDEFEEFFQADLDKIKKEKADLIKIEPLESFEVFKIMEEFSAQLDDLQFQFELKTILQKKNPFQNFKHAIDNSNYRQMWFDFKQKELEKIVENKLNKKG